MNWLCVHAETVDVGDERICTRCRAVLPGRLTEQLLLDAFEAARRDGYHVAACVETDVGWCCATNCPSVHA